MDDAVDARVLGKARELHRIAAVRAPTLTSSPATLHACAVIASRMLSSPFDTVSGAIRLVLV